LGKVRKELEMIERRKSKRTKNNRNNKRKEKRNWTRRFRTQEIDKRRR